MTSLVQYERTKNATHFTYDLKTTTLHPALTSFQVTMLCRKRKWRHAALRSVQQLRWNGTLTVPFRERSCLMHCLRWKEVNTQARCISSDPEVRWARSPNRNSLKRPWRTTQSWTSTSTQILLLTSRWSAMTTASTLTCTCKRHSRMTSPEVLANHFNEVEGHVTLKSGECAHCDFVVVKFGWNLPEVCEELRQLLALRPLLID